MESFQFLRNDSNPSFKEIKNENERTAKHANEVIRNYGGDLPCGGRRPCRGETHSSRGGNGKFRLIVQHLTPDGQ